VKASGWLQSAITTTQVLAMHRSIMLRALYWVAHKKVPNFRTALYNRVIKIDKVKSTHSVSKHLLISLKNFT